jgi:hypothetical protein
MISQPAAQFDSIGRFKALADVVYGFDSVVTAELRYFSFVVAVKPFPVRFQAEYDRFVFAV